MGHVVTSGSAVGVVPPPGTIGLVVVLPWVT